MSWHRSVASFGRIARLASMPMKTALVACPMMPFHKTILCDLLGLGPAALDGQAGQRRGQRDRLPGALPSGEESGPFGQPAAGGDLPESDTHLRGVLDQTAAGRSDDGLFFLRASRFLEGPQAIDCGHEDVLLENGPALQGPWARGLWPQPKPWLGPPNGFSLPLIGCWLPALVELHTALFGAARGRHGRNASECLVQLSLGCGLRHRGICCRAAAAGGTGPERCSLRWSTAFQLPLWGGFFSLRGSGLALAPQRRRLIAQARSALADDDQLPPFGAWLKRGFTAGRKAAGRPGVARSARPCAGAMEVCVARGGRKPSRAGSAARNPTSAKPCPCRA